MIENNKTLVQGVVEGQLQEGVAAALIYSTFPDREAAVIAGRALVEARLVGCINILSGMTAIYVWQGETEIADEVVLLAKVPAAQVAAASAALLALHPYETPALLVLPVPVIGRSYLDWLAENVGVAAGAAHQQD